MSVRQFAKRLLNLPMPLEFTRELVATGECRHALDIGCGSDSPLSAFRPRLITTGIDACPEAIQAAQKRGLHDHYLVADIMTLEPAQILAPCQGRRYDLVTLFDVIEHLPRRQGFELLERLEQLAGKYILIQTPNGFLPQGPDFGNEYQRHLSGWFAHDFEGLGYQVQGSTGTRLFHGYGGELKYRFPGALLVDALLAWLLRIRRHSRHAFNLVAIKDVRGVPARWPARIP